MAVPQRDMSVDEALARLAQEDAIGQLKRREGTMARLGSEHSALKLDWVGMTAWLASQPSELVAIEAQAATLIERGVRHVIWAGMGGSVLTVRVLKALGFGEGRVTLYPLDSTDPTALNAILQKVKELKDWAMVAVALGMTSEEPISHLEWFASVLRNSGYDPALQQMVMALPGSYLERYAIEHGLPTVPLQLDGGAGINGRMSAPGTRVFLTPTALWLAGQGRAPGALRDLLRAAHDPLDLSDGTLQASQWVQLAANIAATAERGVVRLALETPPGWESVRDWSEQLMEESLGKGGKGIVIFAPEALPARAPASVRLRIAGAGDEQGGTRDGEFVIVEPLIVSAQATERLSGLISLFTGLQLTMALYGYLWDIEFAGQPAVEAYKSRARALRDSDAVDLARPLYAQAPLRVDGLALFPPEGWSVVSGVEPASALAGWLREWRTARPLVYLDVTINGEPDARLLTELEASLRQLAVEGLDMPHKLRRAPAAYHSTEQSEMDGPNGVVSLRALALRHEEVTTGAYTPRFLEAQAVATWQAMNAAGRPCFLALYDGDMSEMLAALRVLLDAITAALAGD